ncbi:hypothetical protein CAPTEDRAFT_211963, partial [Capitella teleta]
MEAKKRRSCNWSADEELLLLKAVKGRLGIIDGKFSPSLTRVKKKQAWEEVSAFLASQAGPYRTSEECYKKYCNIKSKAKTKYDHQFCTWEGGKIQATPAEELFLEMAGVSAAMPGLPDSGQEPDNLTNMPST